jgi:hypothetical protein
MRHSHLPAKMEDFEKHWLDMFSLGYSKTQRVNLGKIGWWLVECLLLQILTTVDNTVLQPA